MKDKIINFSIAHAYKTIATLLLLTGFIAIGCQWIIIDDDFMKIIPDNIPSKIEWDRVTNEFGNVDLMFIAFGSKNNTILNQKSLSDLWDVTRSLEKITLIDEVISLSNINRIDNVDDFLEVNVLQNNKKLDLEEINSISIFLKKNLHISKQFLSTNNDYTSIIIRPKANINYADLVKESMQVTDEKLNAWEVYYSGVPYTTGVAPELIQNDVASLMKIGIIIMAFILLLNLRSIYAVGLVFSVIILSLIGMMGFMGWIVHLTKSEKFYFTLLNSSMPILILTIANSDGVHVLTKFFRELRKFKNKKQAIYSTMHALMLPIFLTSLTTVAAFFTLIWAPLNPLTGFGLSLGFGIIWAWILSTTFLPALISLIEWDIESDAIKRKSFLENLIAKFSFFITNYPKRILSIGIIFVLIASFGISMVKVDVNYKTFFKPGTEVRESMEFIDNEMTGSLNIVFRIENEIKDPIVLKEMVKIQKFAELDSNVTLSMSITNVIKQMHRIIMDDNPEFETIPDNRAEVNNLFTMYSLSGDPDDFSALVDYEYKTGIVTALMKSISTDQIYYFVKNMEDYIENNINNNIKISITGMLVALRDLVNLIVKSSIISILSAILIIFIISWIFYRSLLWALFAIVPLTAAVILNFGLMGLFGIKLSHVTAILSSIIIGVGVDFAIHYISTYRITTKEKIDINKVSNNVINDVGYPIVLDAGSNMAFGALLFSSFVPVQYIGGLMVFAMVSTSVGTLTILAASTEIFKQYLYKK